MDKDSALLVLSGVIGLLVGMLWRATHLLQQERTFNGQ